MQILVGTSLIAGIITKKKKNRMKKTNIKSINISMSFLFSAGN